MVRRSWWRQILGGAALVALSAAGCTRSHQAAPEPIVFGDPVHYHVGLNPTSLLAADLNGDGRLDFITTNSNSNNVSVLLQLPQDAAHPEAPLFGEHAMFDVGQRPRTAAVADFNRDGRLDLAVVNNASDDLSILLGNGDGTFQKARTIPLGRSPLAIAAGDLNGDGKADLVVALRFDHLLIFLGSGDGTFAQTASIDPGDTPTAVLLADLNRDGHLDVLVSNNGPMTSSLTIFLGNGDGTLRLGSRYAVKSRPIFAALGRFDQDDLPDVAIVTPFANSVLLLMGDGRGGFREPPTTVSGETEPVAVAVGDFNGDGRNDLAIANTGSSDISILLGKGDGSFGRPQLYRAGSRPMALLAADLNDDHVDDLIVTNNASNDVSVLLALPPSSPAPSASTGTQP